MSVINQMLKELEERAEPSATAKGAQPSHPVEKKSPWGKVVVFLLLIIGFNICGLYIWHLYSENESLKSEVNTHAKVIAETKKETPVKANAQALEPNKLNAQSVDNVVKKIKTTQPKRQDLKPTNTQTIKEANKGHNPDKEPVIINTTKPVINNSVVVTPLNNKNKVTNNIIETAKVSETKPSLSISRSKLSPERVVKNKLLKAERAISENDIAKAEELFEDILLIQPGHKSARKQLSALWFGRKLYRPALNLLSQGIELYPRDIDLRLMKARVLLNQNNNEEALYVLNGFSSAKSAEYQLLLANTAQLLGKPSSVISAYNQLVQLEPYKSKWWMGLAVGLDRNSQFEKAKVAYQTALSTGTLSSNSAQFIRQRMSELGE